MEKVEQGFKAVTIPEKFQKPNSYLQECYYFVRTIYAQHVEGIPRFFRREDLLTEKFNANFHYAEDPELWNRLRAKTGEPATIKDHLLHKEKFSLLYNLKKVRMAAKAQRRMKMANMKMANTEVSRRVVVGMIIGKAPLRLLFGVALILLLRTVVRRLP